MASYLVKLGDVKSSFNQETYIEILPAVIFLTQLTEYVRK